MKAALKKLPFVLALVFSLSMSACSEIEVNPKGEGDDDDTPIIIKPTKPKSNGAAAADTVTVG